MSTRTDLTVGLVGLGNMGSRMAGRLLDAGFDVCVCDLDTDVVARFRARGAASAHTPRELADRSDVVLVSLPRPRDVDQVALGVDGLIAGSRMHTYVDMSTTGPAVAEAVGRALSERGVRVLDAPVSGGPGGAERGMLCIMVAGPTDAFEDCETIFDVLGGTVVRLGEAPGQGQAMKLINNMISASCLAATSEGMVLGVKAGLDPSAMLEVLNASTARNTHSEDKFPRCVLPRTFDFGFQIGLLLKDVRLCLEMADRLEVPMWVSSEVRQLLAFAVSQDGDNQDITTLVKHLERWTGVEVAALPPQGVVAGGDDAAAGEG